MTSVGRTLRQERESQRRELQEIAEELCITRSYLRAIEQDDLKSLPGSFFYKSFVKQYAALLGVDEKTLRSGIEQLTAAEEPLPLPSQDHWYGVGAQDLSNPSGDSPVRQHDPIVQAANRRYFSDRRVGMSLAALGGVLLVCSGFYGWWNKAPQPHGTARVVTANKAPAGIQEVSSTVSDPGTPTVDVTTTTDSDGVKRVVLNLSATEKTWLSISSDGKQIFSGILEPAQTKTLTGLEVAKMRVGNAGGIEVRWNGKAIGPIGARGQVRVVLFTPENFEILEPTQTLSN